MRCRFARFGTGALLILSAAIAPARGQEAADAFHLPDELDVRVWAQSPQLFNPTNIDIDARGRVWVAEGVNYRETIKKQNALKHPSGDRIVILEDTDGDGSADSSKVFAQDLDLICPLGIAVIGDKRIVSCSPNLIVYTDADGDDVPEKKEILLTGFGGRDHDHGVHAVVGGLDGRWYFNVGNMGPHDVTDKSGSRLNSGSCYVYNDNRNSGNRRSDDGRVWTGGLALRVDPDGRNLRVLAHNFRNSYEIPIDSFGNLWQSDNDDDGNQSCRFSWVMEGGNYGFFSADGTRTWQSDRRPGQTTQVAHWHQDDPGVAPVGEITGAGGPTGSVAYEGGLLPEKFIGAVLNCDTGRNRVNAYFPKPSGAGFIFERSDLIATHPGDGDAGADARMFRPSDVAIGTDGAVYVADWYDPVTGGHDIKDKQGGGRILRLAPKGDRTRSPKIELNAPEGQLAALNNPAVNVRHIAANKLVDAKDQALPLLLQQLAGAAPLQRARAAWVLARCGKAGIAAVEKMLSDADERIRLTAFRALRAINHGVLDHATALASDPSPAVRREVAIAMRDVSFDQCREILVELAQKLDGDDRYSLEAFGIACDGKESAIYPILLKQLGDADPLKWSAAFAGIAWRLHPRDSIGAFAARAASMNLPPEARRQAVVALAFIHDARAAEAMAALARTGPEDVRPQAQRWLTARVNNHWRDFPAARHFSAPDSVESKPDPAVLKRLEKDRAVLLDPKAGKRAREAAAARLAKSVEGAKFVLSLAAEGKFPADYAYAVTEPIHRSSDLGVRALAGQYFPRTGAGGVPLPPLDELSRMKGDAQRGRAIFFGATAACSRCHVYAGEGRDVGPDLSAVNTKFGRRDLLDNILNPSAAIAFGYDAWIVKTKDSQVFSGFILADAENVVIKESSGQQRNIPAKQIALRKKQTISVMPDNVAMGLTAQELADVASFLLSRQPVQAHAGHAATTAPAAQPR